MDPTNEVYFCASYSERSGDIVFGRMNNLLNSLVIYQYGSND